MIFRSRLLTLLFAGALATGVCGGRSGCLPAAAQNSPVIAANLRPYLQEYVTPTTRLRAGFIPYKPQIVWGEPLEVTFRVENLGPKEFTFPFGGDYRGTGRHERFKILVTDTSGKPLTDPHANAPNFGGLLSDQVLTSGGPAFECKITLTQYRTFEKPGTYKVTCSFAFDTPLSSAKEEPARPVVSTRFLLTIADRTPERVVAVLEELVAKAQTISQQDLPSALEVIAGFGREDAAPFLIRLTHTGTVMRRAAAIAALPLVPAPSTLDTALAALQDTDPGIRAAAAGALGRIAQPRAVTALLQALRREKSPVNEAILMALGASKSERALPVLAEALDHGNPKARQAAIQGLVAYGGEAALGPLERCVRTEDLPLRYLAALALIEKMHQPLKADWLLPILMRRAQSPEWLDSLRLVRMYAGDQAIPLLCSCLDFDAAWSGRNAWILYQVQACPNAPAADYVHDWNREGTPVELEQNRRTLATLKKLAGPLPPMLPRHVSPSRPALKIDPPIDFTPHMKPEQDHAEIRSGFLKVTISRTSHQVSYTPDESYRALYTLAQRARELAIHPDWYAVLGITEQQARQLHTLPLPPEQPDLTGSTLLYIIYKESPPGPLQQEAEEDLNEAVRSISQSYHAATSTFVAAVRKILSPDQLSRL